MLNAFGPLRVKLFWDTSTLWWYVFFNVLIILILSLLDLIG